jgi:hypothetical protein
MRRRGVMAVLLTLTLTILPYVASSAAQNKAANESGWTTLFDGTNLDRWNAIGNANWKLADGLVQADEGNGFLVSKQSYEDFQIRAEFWVDEPANSGIFIRCSDAQKVTPATCYEVNIYDRHPEFGTGAITDVAKSSVPMKAAGKWNTYEITAQGTHLVVTLNGTRTIDMNDGRHARGPIALQYSAGMVKFRKVQVKPL